MKIAVIGAGWAGLAAAVTLTGRGHRVALFEAAREAGGRARSIAGGLDNGQHILIGAYTQTLRLMREVGVDTDRVLLRTPLDLRDLQGRGIALPDLRPPWNLLVGTLRARGWSWSDRIALLSMAASWQRAGFACNADTTVAQLCARAPSSVMRGLIEPLCVSALNTGTRHASAEVFLRVLQDSLQAGPGASDLLLPRVDLGALFPQAALRWLQSAGASVHLGCRVTQLRAASASGWRLRLAHSNAESNLETGATGMNDALAASDASDAFDALLIAAHAPDAVRLLQTLPADRLGEPSIASWIRAASALRYEAIATVYTLGGPSLSRPMVALCGTAADGPRSSPAQFVFDREQLCGTKGLKAFVASASQGSREEIEAAVIAQAHEAGLGPLRALRTVVEKRATFACTPGLERPGHRLSDSLWACADHVQGPYPSTLEGAVLSALRVCDALDAAKGDARGHTHAVT